MLTHYYNNGSNTESVWFAHEIPLDKLHKDLLKKKNEMYDLHYFLQHNSREELAFCYSKMVASKSCTIDSTHEFFPHVEMAYDNPELYEKQIAELFEFMIDPQEMVITEAMFVLKNTLGIQLDHITIKDLYEYSMYHPNAILCHVCRKIDWKHTRRYYHDDGIIECRSCHRNKRKLPDTGELDLNFETFDLQKYI
jgi:hypothetical protein